MMESYHGLVSSPTDALILLEASRLRLIPKITRRLKESERTMINSGSVFIWNENETRMKRWTDGRSWSASRVHDVFLTYREMESSGQDQGMADFKYKQDGLIKTSFSITTLQGDKLHLISYSKIKPTSTLVRPSMDRAFEDLKIPEGIYPKHAFLDMKEPSSSPNSETSPIPPQQQQPVHYQYQYQNSNYQLRTRPDSVDSGYAFSGLQKLPPLNKSKERLDYDTRALNALDRLSFK